MAKLCLFFRYEAFVETSVMDFMFYGMLTCFQVEFFEVSGKLTRKASSQL